MLWMAPNIVIGNNEKITLVPISPITFSSQAHSFLHSNMGWQFRIFLLAFLLSWTLVSCQDEGSGSGEAAEASGKTKLITGDR